MLSIPKHFTDLEQQEARLERALAAFTPGAQDRLGAALAFARAAHRGQQRKWQPIPYIIHPIRVALVLIEEFEVRDLTVIVAALLHDVVEDCDVPPDVIEQRFGRDVRRYVDGLTWEPGRAVKWEQAERQCSASLVVRTVRAADIIDNCRDLAASCPADRSGALRIVYGYAHWGMRIAARVSADAVRFLRDALEDVRSSCFAQAPEPSCQPNPGKSLKIGPDPSSLITQPFIRYPIRTHVITAQDDLLAVIRKYAVSHLRPGDLLAISERIIAIMQGRAFRIEDVQPSAWAKFLVRFVTKSPYGIGLASPWTMELAIREAGLPRILLAAFVAAVTKPFGIRGLFYRVVGKHINAIDGPCDYTLPIAFSPPPQVPPLRVRGGEDAVPPLRVRGGQGELRADRNPSPPPLTVRGGERYAKLGPKDPNGVAMTIAREIGVDTAIIDANDLGVEILGASEGVDREFVKQVFRDNPLGQSTEQTPLAIVRAVS